MYERLAVVPVGGERVDSNHWALQYSAETEKRRRGRVATVWLDRSVANRLKVASDMAGLGLWRQCAAGQAESDAGAVGCVV